MKPQDWISIAAVVLTLVMTGFAGYLQIEARLSAMEKSIQERLKIEQVMRSITVDLVKEVHHLKGQHEGSSEHEHQMPMNDEPVQAHSWLTESEM